VGTDFVLGLVIICLYFGVVSLLWVVEIIKNKRNYDKDKTK